MEMMKDRNRALKKATKTKLDKDKKYARTIRNLVNQYIKNARSDFIQEQLTNLKDKPKKFWTVMEKSCKKCHWSRRENRPRPEIVSV